MVVKTRVIERLLPEQKIVNEQIVEIMNLSKIENVKPEQMMNSEPQPIVSTSASVEANPMLADGVSVNMQHYIKYGRKNGINSLKI